jgi:hypothetical protein
MIHKKRFPILALAAALTLLAWPLAAGVDEAFISFDNHLAFDVVVHVFKFSDGSLERSAAVPAKSQNAIRYGCGRHRRTFIVYASSDTSRETPLATGSFELLRYEDVNTTGYPCGEMVLPEGEGAVSYTGSTDVRVEYEVTSKNRARFTLYKKLVEDPGKPL